MRGELEFSDVKFNYPTRPDIPVLQGMTLSIGQGCSVALVGASGCGKSTSVGLLERFYDPLSGTVTLDSHDIRTLNLKWLRSQIGLVQQEPVLFGRSIKDNIMYGVPREIEVSEEEVVHAAKSANIHGFINNLPMVCYALYHV